MKILNVGRSKYQQKELLEGNKYDIIVITGSDLAMKNNLEENKLYSKTLRCCNCHKKTWQLKLKEETEQIIIQYVKYNQSLS